MIKVVFFARVREQLSSPGISIEWHDKLLDLPALERQLIAENGELWEQVLGQENLIRAINHTVVPIDEKIHDGDEVAFYPPVTGG